MYWIARRPEYTRRMSRARTGTRPAGPAPQSCAFFRVHARQVDKGGLHSLNNRMNIARASTLALLLALAPGAAFAQSGGQTHSGAQDITGAQSQAIAQKLLPIPKGYIALGGSSQTSLSPEYGPVYMVIFQEPQSIQSPGPSSSVQVTVDARTGQIVQYFQIKASSYSLSASSAKAVSQSAAKRIATTWLARLNPQHARMSLIGSGEWGGLPVAQSRYSFVFAHTVHGIPVAFQSASVMLDAGGQLVGYQADWQQATLPSPPAHALSQQTAEQAYIKALQLRLMYVTPFNPFTAAPGPYVLTYGLTANALVAPISTDAMPPGIWISATTGRALNALGQPIAPTAPYEPLVKGGPTHLPYAHRKQMSRQQAETLAKTVIPSGFTLASSNRSTTMGTASGTSPYYWNFTFQKVGQSSYSVTVNPLWHTIMNMNQFYYAAASPQGAAAGAPTHAHSLSGTRLTAIATAYVEKLNPQAMGALALRPAMAFGGQPGSASRSFIFLDHGIPAQNDIVQVMPDRFTGAVTGYFSSFLPSSPVPAPGRVIPLAQAQEAYARKYPVRLEYVLPLRENPSAPQLYFAPGQSSWTFSSQALLAYVAVPSNPPQFLNAKTGQWQSYQSTGVAVPADIKGHAGEQAMLLLIRNGALAVQNGKAHPDAAMTRGQFITLLVKASQYYMTNSQQTQAFPDVGPGSPNYAAVQQAVLDGILQPGGDFHPDLPVTRNDAAHWLVAYLGYQKLAGESGLFRLPFHDASAIPANDQGDAAIATRLGLIAPQNGNWNGAQPLTVAQAAVAVVAALQFHAGHTG